MKRTCICLFFGSFFFLYMSNCPNHKTPLPPPYFTSFLTRDIRLMPKQTSIMSKKSLQFTPLGPFMTLSGAIFIDRSNSTDAVRSLNAAGQQMKRLGTSLWMFPEGTRHSQEIPDLLPFKKGGFHLAVQAGIPIVPIVTENYWGIYRKNVFGEGRIKVRGACCRVKQ